MQPPRACFANPVLQVLRQQDEERRKSQSRSSHEAVVSENLDKLAESIRDLPTDELKDMLDTCVEELCSRAHAMVSDAR